MTNREIPIFCELERPGYADWEQVKACRDMREAILLCIQLRTIRYTHGDICARLGIDKGHFSRILRGTAHFPPDKISPLMSLCGNYAPLQYIAYENGLDGMLKLFEEIKAA